jgi:hypothetical protein
MLGSMKAPKRPARRRDGRTVRPQRAPLPVLRKGRRKPVAITAILPIADEIFSES